MVEFVSEKIKELNEKYPNWKQNVYKELTDEDESDSLTEETECFFKALEQVCDSIKQNNSSPEVIHELAALFGEDLKPIVEELSNKRLRPFFGLAPIRKKSDAVYRALIESLIDEIWQNHIIRRNPQHKIDTLKYQDLEITTDESQEIIVTLSAIVDHCTSRLLGYNGIVSFIQAETGLSTELSESIARKIDKESGDLRINFIIKSLVSLSN